MEIKQIISKRKGVSLIDFLRLSIWLSAALLCIGTFIWNLSLRYSIFLQPCISLTDCVDPGQILVEDKAALNKLGFSLSSYSNIRIFIECFLGGLAFVIAGFIFIKKYRDWFALFVSISIMASGTVITINTIRSAFPAMDFLFNIIIFLASGYVIFFYVFPNGKFVPRWTIYITCLWMFTTIGRTFFTGSVIDPFTWHPILNFGGWFAFHIIALIAQIYRYKYFSTSIEKQQTKWFLFGLAMMIAGIVIESIIDHSQHLFAPGLTKVFINLLSELLISILLAGIPLSIGIAMHKYKLWDIDYIINRSLLYVGLSAGVIAIYVSIVASISVLFQSSGNLVGSLFASALVAVLFQPLRSFLQRTINRLMYGERDNPYTVITQMGQRLESSAAPQEILPLTVETLGLTLKLPYVAVTIEEDGKEMVLASYGNFKEPALKIPLIYHSELMGTLALSSRSWNDEFSSSEQKLLYDLAPQVGIAINNVRLTDDLQRARKKLVSAREEERKRLRRDLHDSLGPELAGLAMQMDAAKNLIYQKPEMVSTLLTQMNHKLRSTIDDIREIVYALRPPVLDEFGLIYAIKEQIEKLNRAGNQIVMNFEAPESLPELPAAVEAAIYRIVQEAITNVVKHSEAKSCWIKLWIDRDIFIEIVDDGAGIKSERKGIGLHSMKERAEELGGKCIIKSHSDRGTIVSTKIPLPLEGDDHESN